MRSQIGQEGAERLRGGGTRKWELCNVVAEVMVRVVGKMSSRFITGKRESAEQKNAWWFFVKA